MSAGYQFGAGLAGMPFAPALGPASAFRAYASGLAPAEIKNNSGEIIYVENRRLITRAPDQIEDIKLVIEF